MYLRFVTNRVDERTGKSKGIFSVAYEMRDDNEFEGGDMELANEVLVWFHKNLPKPTKFSRKKNDSYKNTNGIAWMKDSSKDVINRLWELKFLLERHGVVINMLQTDRPGYVVYEDEHQIVAEPFNRETPN